VLIVVTKIMIFNCISNWFNSSLACGGYFCCSAVHLARFATSGVHLFSGSDDKTVRLWDAATESELQCFSDHQVMFWCGVLLLLLLLLLLL